ncbi:hypothetical protein H105_09006 [Trichophyton soudanense CBS 452.61]|uniref:HNH nuclease domain-containing protein n=1 Tax=Trichophyton soudanense CBS 452.61 TaxID=1215331 RepID=A0A022XDC6_TRISD|nr:hypothetical protein H105_09006 [Trichophyton soudanense CBS 452.61]
MDEHCPGYGFDDEERVRLIAEVRELLQTVSTSSALWACLWLSDLPRLERLVADASSPSNKTLDALSFASFDSITKQWLQLPGSGIETSSKKPSPAPKPGSLGREAAMNRIALTASSTGAAADEPAVQAPQTPPRAAKRPRLQSRSPSPLGSGSTTSRSQSAARDCRERDGDRCTITKAYHPIDVAHIYPYSMRNTTERGPGHNFWNLLSYFWTEEHVNSWYESVFPRGTEVVENLLCLAPQMHRYHGSSLFALKPIHISDDKKRLLAKFYWLTSHQKSDSVDISTVPTLPSNLTGRGDMHKAWNIVTEKKIISGDEIVFETSDPENLPLPDWNLLDMQWTLQRVAALTGAADMLLDDSEDDDSDDGGIEWDEGPTVYSQEVWEEDRAGLRDALFNPPPIPQTKIMGHA